MFSKAGWTRIGAVVVLAAVLLAACAPGISEPAAGAASGLDDSAQVAIIGELALLDADSARVGGATLAVDSRTQVESGLKVSQSVRAEAVMSGGELTAVAITAADAPPGQSFELIGVVQSQGASAWVIGGQTVLVSTATEIKGAPGVGTRVKAQGSLGAAGEFIAREIRRLDGGTATPGSPAAGDEFEFFGTVTSIGADTWTIGGQTVRVTAQTEVKAGVGLNVFVKVHASAGADGVLTAREIEPAAPAAPTGTPPAGNPPAGGEVEFRGVLSTIAGDLWTVGATVVRVSAATEIKDNVQVGDTVKVHASAGADGVLVAREIERSAQDGNSGPGNGDDDDQDDNSGPGNGDDDDQDDNSGPGNRDDDDDDGDDDNSGPGNRDDDDDDDDDDNSGPGNRDDNKDDNSGRGGGDDD